MPKYLTITQFIVAWCAAHPDQPAPSRKAIEQVARRSLRGVAEAQARLSGVILDKSDSEKGIYRIPAVCVDTFEMTTKGRTNRQRDGKESEVGK